MGLESGWDDPEKDVLKVLEKECKKYPLLSREAEQKWISQYKDSLDPAARKEAITVLVTRNFGLIFKFAKKPNDLRTRNPGATLTTYDLVIEGVLGLIHAVDKYDRSRLTPSGQPLKLSTYATWWIKQYIQRAMQDKGRAIRIPIHIHDLLNRVSKAHGEFCSTHPDRTSPTSLELSLITGIPEPMVKVLGTHKFDIDSIDRADSTDEDESLSIASGLKAEDKYQPDSDIEAKGDKAELLKLLKQLPDDECSFMMLKYGFADGIDRNDKEMASLLKWRPKDCTSFEKAVLEKLRNMAERGRFSL